MKPHHISALTFVLAVSTACALTACGSDDSASRATPVTSMTNSAGDVRYGPGPSIDIGGAQTNLRDVRYCEILPVTRDKEQFTATVYNTIGLNTCPEDQWQAITKDAVKQAYPAIDADLNGPRHWVLDGIDAEAGSDSASNDSWYFGGIQMGKRGSLQAMAREAISDSKPYNVKEVTRHTTWTYDAGQPVFELTAPDGSIYTMQSYAQIVDPNLSYNDLPTLTDKIHLPQGWTYNVRMLDSPLNIIADGTAYVVQDDLKNSYMRR
ncbi:hypothetical protein ACWF9G_27865 [Nocardia sp. NPDC055029]